MRPTRDETMLKIARDIAERSTCCRRKVGCVLADEHGRVLSMGHNGVPMGHQHCTEHPCTGSAMKSGTGLDHCLAIHAETNALMFCSDIMKIHTAYVTASPCKACTKALLNTSCRNVVYLDEYPHLDAQELWLNSGRIWWQHGN
jgi:dCMP deaminase